MFGFFANSSTYVNRNDKCVSSLKNRQKMAKVILPLWVCEDHGGSSIGRVAEHFLDTRLIAGDMF
jgi:hypothetical protein